jgi:hypothetical protein
MQIKLFRVLLEEDASMGIDNDLLSVEAAYRRYPHYYT